MVITVQISLRFFLKFTEVSSFDLNKFYNKYIKLNNQEQL